MAAHSPYYIGHRPQGPPSPPFDDSTRCSLPSISNLLDLADQGSPTSETAPHAYPMQLSSSHQRHPQLLQQSTELSYYSHSSRPNTRPNSAHFTSTPAGLRSNVLPPTPPTTSEASFGGYDSPAPTKPISSRNSCCEATPPPQYAAESSTQPYHTQPYHQRQHDRNAFHPTQQSQRTLPPISMPAYQPHHHQPSVHPTPPPENQVSSLYFQRPLPRVNSFPLTQQSPSQQAAPQQQLPQTQRHHSLPQLLPQPTPQQQRQQQLEQQVAQSQAQQEQSPWQHHHYISPAMAATFPLAHDRYVCGTCSKAFSRPSSLRIHSHSHTGEKPFKCPHQGCGKAFSVRSNMKRHERGCHNFSE